MARASTWQGVALEVVTPRARPRTRPGTAQQPPSCIPDEDPPAWLLCPITQEAMIDPVITVDGFTYEREAIAQWLEKNGTSPLTGEPLPVKMREGAVAKMGSTVATGELEAGDEAAERTRRELFAGELTSGSDLSEDEPAPPPAPLPPPRGGARHCRRAPGLEHQVPSDIVGDFRSHHRQPGLAPQVIP